ncbi:MAG: 50S ribosomal protein L11 methyltransferase [Candidatus Aenigmatarchaeota archaeon]
MPEFNLFDIECCLLDGVRTKAFVKTVRSVVRKGDVVIDAGSGSGLLGVIAAKAGARKVYCIELDRLACDVIRRSAVENNVADKIVVVRGDATKVELPEKADVLISENISGGGLFYEKQVQINNHLLKFMKKGARFVPQEIRNSVQLCHAKESFEGFRYLECRASVKEDEVLSASQEFAPIFHGEPVDERIDSDVVLTAKKNGTVNAVRFDLAVRVQGDIKLEQETPFMICPTILFLKYPIKVSKGERYVLKLRFKWGCNPRDVELALERA